MYQMPLSLLAVSILVAGCGTTPWPAGSGTPAGVSGIIHADEVVFTVKLDGKGRQRNPRADNDIASGKPIWKKIDYGWKSTLSMDTQSVWLDYDYFSNERGRKGTQISGSNRIKVFSAFPGYIIDRLEAGSVEIDKAGTKNGIRATGGTTTATWFHDVENYGKVRYWDSAKLVVDSKSKNDVKKVGLRGKIRFRPYQVPAGTGSQ